jgi:FixJ family two-component response regulator
MEPGILFLDDDGELRRAMSALIQDVTGRKCLALTSLDQMRTNREFVLTSALAILDVNLGPGQPSGIDAYTWLLAEKYAGKIVFLTGHAANHPLVERAAQMDGVRVFHKPVDMQELAEMIRGAL